MLNDGTSFWPDPRDRDQEYQGAPDSLDVQLEWNNMEKNRWRQSACKESRVQACGPRQ